MIGSDYPAMVVEVTQVYQESIQSIDQQDGYNLGTISDTNINPNLLVTCHG